MSAIHLDFASELQVFVSDDAIALDTSFVNRGELGGELELTAALVGDTDAVFTGGSASNGLSEVGNGIVLVADGDALSTLDATILNNTITAQGFATAPGGRKS